MSAKWKFEDIVDLNPPAEGREHSRLDRLISFAATTPDILCATADKLESLSTATVACFFQLPEPIWLENDWFVVPTSMPGIAVHFHCKVLRLVVEQDALPKLVEVDAKNANRGRLISQITALVPLWGNRLAFYLNYRQKLEADGPRSGYFVPTENSWLPLRQPLDACIYEDDIVNRMVRFLPATIWRLLKIYGVHNIEEPWVPRWLHNYFAMTAPGRVAYSRMPDPLTRFLVERNCSTNEGKPFPTSTFNRAIRLPSRNFSRFERQIFALDRLRVSGENELAFVGTWSLIEWFLNALFQFKAHKQISLAMLLRRPELEFLDSELVEKLDRARKIRNSLVHGSPPDRSYYFDATMELTAAEDGEYSRDRVKGSDVRDLIETAFSIFRAANANKLTTRLLSE